MDDSTDYSGYKECGHPEYRNTDTGPQLNDCGCDDLADNSTANYAEASAAHAAINTTDLPRGSHNTAWSWATLREVMKSDLRLFNSIKADQPAEFTQRRMAAKIEAVQALLDSMDTIEALNTAPSVPGLAEHTAAACDTIKAAGR